MLARGFQKMMRLSLPALSSSAASGVKRSAREDESDVALGYEYTNVRIAYVCKTSAISKGRFIVGRTVGRMRPIWRVIAAITPMRRPHASAAMRQTRVGRNAADYVLPFNHVDALLNVIYFK